MNINAQHTFDFGDFKWITAFPSLEMEGGEAEIIRGIVTFRFVKQHRDKYANCQAFVCQIVEPARYSGWFFEMVSKPLEEVS